MAVAVLAAAGGYFAAMFLSGNEPASSFEQSIMSPVANQPADLVGQRRPDFELVDTNGVAVTASDFDGQVLLINFWATWCKPCVEEMPMLSELQRAWAARGLKVLGVALDDPDRARDFAADMGISYPVALGRTDVVLTGRRYGNSTGLLPFSVLVDRQGTIRWTYLGALDKNSLEQELLLLD